jgi:hypothetical protein
MPAMRHITRIVLAYSQFRWEIGFAWNAPTMEPMKELRCIPNLLTGDLLYRGKLPQEHQQVCDVVDNE